MNNVILTMDVEIFFLATVAKCSGDRVSFVGVFIMKDADI